MSNSLRTLGAELVTAGALVVGGVMVAAEQPAAIFDNPPCADDFVVGTPTTYLDYRTTKCETPDGTVDYHDLKPNPVKALAGLGLVSMGVTRGGGAISRWRAGRNEGEDEE